MDSDTISSSFAVFYTHTYAITDIAKTAIREESKRSWPRHITKAAKTAIVSKKKLKDLE